MATRKMLACREKIISEFRNDEGLSLAEMERRTSFAGTKNNGWRTIRYGDPEHQAIWERYQERLIADVEKIMSVMAITGIEAFVGAARLMHRQLPHGTGCYDPNTRL